MILRILPLLILIVPILLLIISQQMILRSYSSPTNCTRWLQDYGVITGNVTINSNNILEGDNVTIYVKNGDFTINGTAQINLSASTDTHASPEIPGVLIYVPAPDPCNASLCTNHTVKLDGTSTSTFFGSIVAPCSKVTLTGTGGNTYIGQIVGWNVEVGGDATLNLTYNENLAASSPTSMELHK